MWGIKGIESLKMKQTEKKDICQPIYIETKNGEKHFCLIIKDMSFEKNDFDRFNYVASWDTPYDNDFRTAEETTEKALITFPIDKEDIVKIRSMSMNEFLSDDKLKGMIK
jgi:hypothetical protein